MKASKVCKRLLSVVLALAMLVSMFAALDISSFAAPNALIKSYIANAEHPNGSETKNIDASYYNHSYNSVTDYHYGDVTAVDSFKNADESEEYRFRNWNDTAYFYTGSTYVGYEIIPSVTAKNFTYDFTSNYSLSGTALVDGAVYDTYYRIIINNAAATTKYVKYSESFELPLYDGTIPSGKTFVAWKEENTGRLYAPGANIIPDSAKVYNPWFADIDDLHGYFVYFKDYSTEEVYKIVYHQPGKTILYAAPAPLKEGYTFEYWYMNDSQFDAGELIPDESPDKTVFYAKWSANSYNIDTTSQVSGNAYVNVSSTTAPYGSVVTFTVGDTNANENIVGVEVMGTEHSRYYAYQYDADSGVYSFNMPAEDVAIKVDTSIDEYAVTFLDENGGYYASRTVQKGNTLSFFNMPFPPFKAGYNFTGWYTVGGFGSTEFTMGTVVNDNIVVKATYTGLEFAVTKADDCDEELEYLYVESSNEYKNLTDNIITQVDVQAGDKVYINVAPIPTYNITGVAVREKGTGNFVVAPTLLKKYKDASNNDCYQFAFEMPINDVEIAVYVSPNSYIVSVEENVDANGQYRINGVDTTNLAVAQGSNAVIDIIPEKGYYVDEVTSFYNDVNNNIALPAAILKDNDDGTWTYSFPMVSADVSVSIKYKAYEYKVNVTESNDATYNPDWIDYDYFPVESISAAKTSKGLVTLYDALGNEKTEEVKIEPGTGRMCTLPANFVDAIVGQQVCFKVDEFIGYDLASVIVTYDDGTKSCPTTFKDGKYYFTMPNKDVTIKANFVEETYKVYKTTESEEYNSASEHEVMGEVNINGLREKSVSADYKTTVTVTAAPKAGYYVETISYTLKNGTNKDGKTVVDFSNAENYSGTQITDGADTTRSIEFYMPACDVDIAVTYGKIKYSVETEVTSGDATGSITVTSVNTYKDQITCDLEPAYGYTLASFEIKNLATGQAIPSIASKINQTYGSEYKFTMPASKVKITATYVKDAYTVIYKDSDNSVILTEAIKFEETATLSATPVATPSGKHFIGWASNDTKTPVTTASLNTADFVINKATVINAVYEADNTKVVFNKTANGCAYNDEIAVDTTKTASQSHVYKYGDTINFKAVPDEGYMLDKIEVTCKAADGVSTNYVPVKETATGYSFEIPAIHKSGVDATDTDDLTVSVTFKKVKYTLSAQTKYTGGKVAVDGTVSTKTTFNYDYAQLVTITAKPNKGYYVKSIVATMNSNATSTENAAAGYSYKYTGTMPKSGVTGSNQTIKFPMPATDMTCVVVFEKCKFNINTVSKATTAGTHGKVTTSPASTAKLGDVVKIVADPDDGYKLSKISVVDEKGNPLAVAFKSLSQKYVATYSFTMPAANVTVTGVFKQVASREYIDVRDDDWHYDAVNFVSDRGYFKGYGATGERFGVSDNILREDFVVVIARMSGADLSKYKNVKSSFVDVKKDAYYAPAIAWAVEKGIICGYKDGSNRFGVGDSIIRQDIVTILYRYAKYKKFVTKLSADAAIKKDQRYSKYKDLKELGSYAKEAMAWGVGYGVLKGTTDYSLSPLKTATRAEVAQMIKNLYDHNIAR